MCILSVTLKNIYISKGEEKYNQHVHMTHFTFFFTCLSFDKRPNFQMETNTFLFQGEDESAAEQSRVNYSKDLKS